MIRKSFFLTILLALLLSSIEVWAATAPSVDAKYISFRSVTKTSASIKWVKGSGGTGTYRSMVTIKAVSNNMVPVGNETVATINALSSTTPTFGSGYSLSGGMIVYYGTGNSITVSGLTAGTVYDVKIFSFNDDNTGSTNDYFTNALMTFGSPTQNPRTFTTLDDAITAPSSLALTSINTGGFAVSWSAGAFADGYITNLAKTSDFTSNSSYLSECAYYREADLGNTTSFEFDGLSTGTTYYWNLYGYNNGGNSSTVTYSTNNADGRVGTLSTTPSGQASDLAFAIPTGTGAANLGKINITGITCGSVTDATKKYLIVAREGSANNGVPTNGVIYTSALNFTGTALGGGKVVYYGDGSDLASAGLLTGFSNNTQVYFKVYVANTHGLNNTTNYSDVSYESTGYEESFSTLALEVTGAPALAGTPFTSLSTSGTGYTLNWTAGSASATNAMYYLVVGKLGSTVPSFDPVDGLTYGLIPNLDITNVPNTVNTNEHVLYYGTGTSAAITGLTAKTQYSFKIYAFNEGINIYTANYLNTATITASRYTLAVAPTQPTSATAAISFSGGEGEVGKLNVTWSGASAANTLGYLVTGIDNSASLAGDVPSNGQAYTANTTYTGASALTTTDKLVYNSTVASTTISALTNKKIASFNVYAYNWDGTNAETINYTGTPASASRYTLISEVGAASAITLISQNPTTLGISWTTNGTSHIGDDLVGRPGLVKTTYVPADGAQLSGPNLAIGSGSALGADGTKFLENYVGYAGQTRTVTGLTSGNPYVFSVFTYDDDGISAATTNFNATTPASATFFTLSDPLVTNPSAPVFTNLDMTSYTLSWTAPTPVALNTTRYLVVAKLGTSTTPTDPTSGVYNYTGTANSTSSYDWVAQATIDYTPAPTYRVVYDGTGTTLNFSNLVKENKYTFTIWAYTTKTDVTSGMSNTRCNYNFNATEITATRFTISDDQAITTALAPTVATPTTLKQLSFTWTDGATYVGGTTPAYLGVVYPTGTATDPTKGSNYSTGVNANYTTATATTGGGNKVVFNADGDNSGTDNVVVTGLTSDDTQYTFDVYAYNYSGTPADGTQNYNVAGKGTVSRYTLGAAATQPAAISISYDGTYKRINLTSNGTVNNLITVTKTTDVEATPLNGIDALGTTLASNPVNFSTATGLTNASSPSTVTKVVAYYNGSNPVTQVSNLSPNTQYTASAYEFGGTIGHNSANYSTVRTTNFYSIASEPTSQASAVTIGTRTTSGFTVSWTKGAFTGTDDLATLKTLVTVQVATGTVLAPSDGTQYTAATNFTGDILGSTGGNERVVYASTGTSVAVTGLATNTNYIVRVYAYREGTDIYTANYLGTPATNTAYTLSAEPTVRVSAAVNLGVTANTLGQLDISNILYDGTGGNYTLVSVTPNGTLESVPVDGTFYTSNANVKSATAVGSSTFTWLDLAAGGSTQSITNLDNNTQYDVTVYTAQRTTDNTDINYLTSSVRTASRYTLAATPTGTPGTPSFSVLTNDQPSNKSGYTVSWVNAGTDPNVIVILAPTVTAPTDGTSYTAVSGAVDYSSPTATTAAGSVVLYNGAQTGNGTTQSVVVTKLATSTQYTAIAYYYTGTRGTGAENYGTPSTSGSRYTLDNEPTTQAGGSVTLNVPSSTSASPNLGKLNISAIDYTGNGNSLLLSITPTGSGASDPVDGTFYTSNSDVKSATAVGSSTFTLLSSVITTQSLSNLDPNTSYTIRSYDANTTNSSTDINYLLTTPTPTVRYTLATDPTGTPGTPSFSALTNVSANPGTSGYTVSWVNAGTDPNVIVVLAPTVTAPTDGTSYAAVSGAVDYSTPTAITAAGSVVLFNGAQTGTGTTQTVAVTGLAPNTSYTAIAYYYNGTRGSGAENYGTASSAGTRYTLSNEASVQPATLTSSNVTIGGLDLTWTAGAGESSTSNNADAINYIVTIQPAAGTPVAPSDGTDYTSTSDYSTGGSTLGSTGGNEKVVYVGTGLSVTGITGLSANTQYTVRAYEYRAGGAGSANYFATARTATVYTLVNEPTTAATLANPTVQTDNTGRISLAWSGAAAGATGTLGYLVVAQDATNINPVTEVPTDGINLTATDNIFNNSNPLPLGSVDPNADEIVYKGTGSLANITGLSPNTQYNFVLYTYASGGQTSQINYKTDVTSSKDRFTLDIIPNAPSAVTFANLVNTGSTRTMDVSWTDGAAQSDYTLAVATLDGTTPAIPSDGNSYTAVSGAVNVSTSSSSISGTTLILYNGPVGTSTVNLTAVKASAKVNVVVYHYNGETGTGAENYGTSVTNNRYFLANPATAATLATPTPSLTLGDASLGQLNYTWTGGSADQTVGYLLVASTAGAAVSADPSNGVAYTANAAYTSGDAIGNGYVVYKGTGASSGAITGLGNTSVVTSKLYTYNWDGTNAETKNYNSSSARSTTTAATCDMTPAAPAADDATTSSASLNITSNDATVGRLNLTWNGSASGNESYLVLAKEGSAITDVPNDGTAYTANTDYSAATALGASKIVYQGTTASTAITGLTAATNVYFKVYKTNANNVLASDNSMSRNYTLVEGANAYTPTAEPTNQATSLAITSLANTGYTVGWTAASPAVTGYVVVAKSGASASSGVPTDGTVLTAGDASVATAQALGNGELVYTNTSNSVAVTGLTAKTEYTFQVYAYNYDGANANTVNYKTGSVLSGSRYTLANTPSVAGQGFTASGNTPSGFDLNWTSIDNIECDSIYIYGLKGSTAPTLGAVVTDGTSVGVADVANADISAVTPVLVYKGAATGPGTGSVTLSNLVAGNNYSFRIIAANANSLHDPLDAKSGQSNAYASLAILTAPTAASEPTTQITSVTASNKLTTSVDIAVAGGNGAKTLVSVQAAAAGATHSLPLDVNTYVATNNLGNSTIVKKVGTGTSVSLSGLTAGTKYAVRAYAYNDDGTAGMENYKTDVENYYSLDNPGNVANYNVIEVNTLMTAPSTQPSAITYTNSTNLTTTTSQFTVNWNAPGGAGAEKYLVIVKQGGNPNFAPLNSSSYTTSTDITGGGTYAGESIAYVGATRNFTYSTMTPGLQYNFAIYAFNDNGNAGSENYYPTAATSNRKCVEQDPKTFSGVQVITNDVRTESTIDISWPAAVTGSGLTPTGYIVVATDESVVASHAVYPTDATNYSAGSLNSNGNYMVIVKGNVTTASMTNLTSGTSYVIRVYPYSQTGSDNNTINYLSGASGAGTNFLEATFKTLATKPTAAPSALTFGAKTTTSTVLNWNTNSGASNVLVVRSTDNIFTEPLQGTDYTTGGSIGSDYVVYSGSAKSTDPNATGMSVYTQYYYRVYNYNVNGLNTANYDGFGTNGLIESGDWAENNTYTLVNEPGAPGVPVASNITESSIDLTWTAAIAGSAPAGTVNYLVIAKAAGAPTDLPSDGIAISAGDNSFATNQVISTSGEQIVYTGTALTTTVSGLSGNTSYTFKVFAYAVGAADATSANYNTGSPTSVTQATLASPVTLNASAIVYSSMTNTGQGMTIGWTAGAAPTNLRYLVVARAGANGGTTAPTNGTDYSGYVNTSYGSGTALGDGYVIFDGTSTSVAVTNLIANSQYTYQVYAYNRGVLASSSNYTQVGGTVPYSTTYTLAGQNSAQATLSAYSNKLTDGTGVTVNWTGGTVPNTLRYLVVARASTSPATTAPTNGSDYSASANAAFGSALALGNGKIVYDAPATSGTSVAVTGLTSATDYTFQVYAYNRGANAGTNNYSGVAVNNSTVTTLATKPSAPTTVTMPTANRTTTGMRVNWVAGGGTSTLVLASTSATPPTLVNGDSYAGANLTYASASTVLASYKVIYNGVNANTVDVVLPSSGAQYYFYVYDFNGSAGIENYSDVASANNWTIAGAITGQATAPTYTSKLVDGTGMTVNWTGGTVPNTLRYLVVARQGTSAGTTAPTNGTDYSSTANAAFGTTALGDGFIVYDGTGTSVPVTALTANTQYTFQVYAYNQNTNAATNNYTGVAVNNSTGITLMAKPSAPTVVNMPNANRTTTGMRVSWTVGNGANTLVLASTSSTPPTLVNGDAYAGANLTYASASTVLTSYKVIYNNTNTNSVDVVLPSTGTQYYFYVYDYNGTSGAQNYSDVALGNHFTLAAQPTAANTIGQSANAGGNITLTFNNPDNTASALVVYKSGASPTVPTDGAVYSTGAYGTSSVVVTNGAASPTDAQTASVTGLFPGTSYTFDVFSYEGASQAGTSNETGGTNNYAGTATPVTIVARSAEPTGTPAALSFTNVTGTGFTIDYSALATSVAGETKYLVIVSTNTLDQAPVDGTTYVAGNTAFANGGALSTAFNSSGFVSSIVYNGTSTGTVAVTNLSAAVTYNVAVYAYAEATTSGSENYMATTSTTTQGTLDAEPTTQVTLGTHTKTATSISVVYSGGNGDSRLVVYRAGAAPTSGPTDGVSYANGDALGGGFVYNETDDASPALISSLSSSTDYYFAVYEYNGSGSTKNYLLTGAPAGMITTNSAPTPTQLAITAGASPYTTGVSESVTVQIRDADGNPINAANNTGIIYITLGASSATVATATTSTGQNTYVLTMDLTNFNSGSGAGNGGAALTLTAKLTGLTDASQSSVVVIAKEPTNAPNLTLSKNVKELTLTISAGVGNTGTAVLMRKGLTSVVFGDFATAGFTDGTAPSTATFSDGVTASPQAISCNAATTIKVSPLTNSGLSAARTYKVGIMAFTGVLGTPSTYNYSSNSAHAQLQGMYMKRTNGQTGPDDNDYSEDGSGFDMSSILTNPVVDKVEFDLYNYADGVFNIQVSNLNGDVVATGYNNTMFNKGTQRISIPISSNIAAGSYYITISNGTDIQIANFIVMP